MAENYGGQKSELLEDAAHTAPAPEQDAPGELLELIAEKYRVLEKIGSGGMSTVYKVQHVLLNKVYALKVLHHIKDDSILRFQQEAKASSLLEHPNIVRVHDFGIAAGLPYMTMDYLEGLPLGEFLKQTGAFSTKRVTHIFGQICSALAHAHERGIIHRDLKPSNIIIKTLEDGFEQAIVVDYGIAKIISEDTSPLSAALTKTGEIFGTPLYMSPEQCQALPVDARSDIYSLGCVIYEAMTGSPPFQGSSVYEIIHKQITEAPAPFPGMVRKTKSGRRLEAAVLKSMAKSPEDRQQHVLELSSELKSTEIGGGGFITDLRILADTVSGRLKAAERRIMLLKVLLGFSFIAAILLCMMLIVMPGYIKSCNKEIDRNNRIKKKLDDAFFRNELWTDFPQAKRKSDKTVNSLTLLCNKDPRQKEECAKFAVCLKKAMWSTGQLKPKMRKEIVEKGIGLDSFQGLEDLAEKEFTVTLVAWVDADKSGSELMKLCTENLERTNETLLFCSILTACTCLLTAIMIPLLPVLIVMRFRHLQTAKRVHGSGTSALPV